MGASMAAVIAAGCAPHSVVREVHVREQGLFLPDAIQPAEPVADRVTVLTTTGKNLVFRDAIIGRADGELVVRGDGEPVHIALADARAVQIERNLVGPDADHLKARAPELDTNLVPTWTLVLGLALVTVGTVFVIAEQQD